MDRFWDAGNEPYHKELEYQEASFVIEKRCTLDLLACAASLAAIYAIYAAGTVCLYAMWWPPARAPSAHTA